MWTLQAPEQDMCTARGCHVKVKTRGRALELLVSSDREVRSRDFKSIGSNILLHEQNINLEHHNYHRNRFKM